MDQQKQSSVPLLDLTKLYFDHRRINGQIENADRELAEKNLEHFVEIS